MPVGLVRAREQEIERLSAGDELGRNLERAAGIGLANGIAKQGAEPSGECLDGEEEIDLGNAHPAAAIEREAAAGHDTVDVGMEHEGLTPGVQNGEDAHARAEPRCAEVEQSLACASKQDRVDDLGSMQSQDIEDRRDGEDDVKVRDVEHFIASRVEPSFPRLTTAPRTVTIAARVPEDVLEAAGVAAVPMTAKGGRTAVGHGTHHLALGGIDRKPPEEFPAFGASNGTE